MPQTPDVVQAVWDAARSAVVGTLPPTSYDRRLVLAAITGPSATTLTIYRGYVINAVFQLSRVFPADARTYDSTMGDAPLVIRAGEAATFAWTGGAAGVGQTATAACTWQWGNDGLV